VFEAHVDRSEQLDSTGELSADPPAHEEASENEAHDAAELVREHNQEGRDEEGVSRAHTLREGQGASIGQEGRWYEYHSHHSVDTAVKKHPLVQILLKPFKKWFDHSSNRFPVVHNSVS
jgi:hypothetical protein